MPDSLPSLLPIWAERCPDECYVDKSADGGTALYCGDDMELRARWPDLPGGAVSIIGAVTYHAHRRGTPLDVTHWVDAGILPPDHPEDEPPPFVRVCADESKAFEREYDPTDPADTLRATAEALLSAYLDSLPSTPAPTAGTD